MPMSDEESVAIVEVRRGAIPDTTRDNWEDEYQKIGWKPIGKPGSMPLGVVVFRCEGAV